ncbi:hypothetical protein H8959_014508 [Pygathrix nigripes]
MAEVLVISHMSPPNPAGPVPENYCMPDLGQVPRSMCHPTYLTCLADNLMYGASLGLGITYSAPGNKLKPLKPTAAVLVSAPSSPPQALATAVPGAAQNDSSSILFSLFTSGAGEGLGGESPYVRPQTVSANPQQPEEEEDNWKSKGAVPCLPPLNPDSGRGLDVDSQNGLLGPAALEGAGIELSQVCVGTTFKEWKAGLRPRGWGGGFCLPVLHRGIAPPSPCTNVLFDSLKRLPEKKAAQIKKKLSRTNSTLLIKDL